MPNFSGVSLDEFGDNACKMQWPDFKERYKEADLPKILATACFEAAYYSALLSGEGKPTPAFLNGYGFAPADDQIHAATALNGNEISWALGLAVVSSMNGSIEAMMPL